MSRIYLFLISLLVISHNLFPQVKIKEKVDIIPKTSKVFNSADTCDDGANPWYYSYHSGIEDTVYLPDQICGSNNPYFKYINVDYNFPCRIIIKSGGSNVHFKVSVLDRDSIVSDTSGFTPPNCFPGNYEFMDPGNDFVYDHNKLTYLFFDGSPGDIEPVEIEYGNYFDDVYTPVNLLRFNAKAAIYSINNYEYDYYIYSGMKHYLKAYMVNQCGIFNPSPSPSVKFKAEIINGQDLGTLYYDGNGTSGNTLENIKQYNGMLDSLSFIGHSTDTVGTANVTIRISSNDPTIAPVDVNYTIMPSPLIINISPPTLNPGDTANIRIQLRYSDGTIHDFDPDQIFSIGILKGCVSGNLLVGGKLGVFFDSVKVPFKFIADTSGCDTGSVKIRVGYELISSKIRVKSGQNKFKGGIEKIVGHINNKDNNRNSLNVTKDRNTILGNKCILEFYRDVYDDCELIVGEQATLNILYPTKDSPNEKITNEPKMPTVTCLAELKNCTDNNVKFEWEYWVGYNYLRREVKEDGSIPLCSRETKFKFAGTSVINSDLTTTWTVPFTKDALKYMSVIGTIPERNESKHSGYPGDCKDSIGTWEYGNNVFTGGQVYVKVTAFKDDGTFLAMDSKNANFIIGKNPNPSDVVSAAGPDKKFKAILSHESGRHQFTYSESKQSWPYNKKGFPFYGPPNGYGLLQVDNMIIDKYFYCPREVDLWNWRSNIETGRSRFSDAIKKTHTYLGTYGYDDPNEESAIFLLNAFERYNAGDKNKNGDCRLYSVWNGTKLIPNPKQKWRDYGDAVYIIFRNPKNN